MAGTPSRSLTGAQRARLAAGTIAAALVFFFAFNLGVGQWVTSARLDLTEDKRFTISEATGQALARIREPIRLRFYLSDEIERLGPGVASHAQRVADLLAEYERRAEGRLIVERLTPQPYSPEEDQAVSDGLRGVPIDAQGTQVFFGLAGVNSTDDLEAIPFFTPDRARFLEYDLTRLIADLAQPIKPQVAVIGALPLQGGPETNFQSMVVLDQLRQFFDVRILGGTIDAIAPEVGVLILAQPGDLDERTLFAIDQFALRGGRILALLDPHPESMQVSPQAMMQGRQQPPPADFASLEPLLAAWGVRIAADEVVGDPNLAERVQWMDGSRPVVVDYVAWIGAGPERFDADNPLFAQMQKLNFLTPGAISVEPEATIRLSPLVTTTASAGTIPASDFAFRPDPVRILREFSPGGVPLTLAARIEGQITTAFPDGPPTDWDGDAGVLDAAQAPFSAVIIADSDFATDQAWLQTQNVLGQRFAVPVANNGDFLINVVEQLAGAEGLAGLRGRGVTDRPFTVIENMRRVAEANFRAKEEELLAQIRETEAEIRALQEQEAETGVLMTAEQQAEIERFRDEVLGLRRELRDVRFALTRDVERLQNLVQLLVIWSVPALLALIAIGLALWRHERVRRRVGAGT